MGKLEELMENARLGILNGGGRSEEEGDRSGCWRKCFRGRLDALRSRHVRVKENCENKMTATEY